MKLFLTILAFALLTSVCGEQKDPPIDKKKLIGHWISLEDKNYQMEFTSSTRTEYYGKDVESVSTYRFDKNTLIATDKATGEDFKYSVIALTDKNLTLLYLDRGNTLKFKRK